MNDPPLRFNDTPYHWNQLGNILAEYRAKGYVILRGVFERDSVDEFLECVLAAAVKNEHGRCELPEDRREIVWPLYAPRIRQVLPPALSPAVIPPRPSLLEASWVFAEPNQEVSRQWHKDQRHEGISGREYQYPLNVHLGMYFRDMEHDDGPTEVVPGSHWDDSRNPYNDSPIEQFLPRKEDVVLWDQRCWHCASTRRKTGLRVFGIFGFYPIVRYQESPGFKMKTSVARAWMEADNPVDETFFGGQWSRESIIEGIDSIRGEDSTQ